MKKVVLTLLSILTLSTLSHAQDIKYGIKGGLNLANFNGELAGILDFEGDYITGFHAGAMASIGISDRFAIQPEILFSTLGTTQTISGVEGDITLSYIQIPVYAKVYAAEGFAFMAGPQFGYLVDSDFSVGSTGVSTDDLINIYKDTDFGINLGAQYEFDMGLTLGANYYLGLTEVDDIPIVNVNNRAFMFSAGFFINSY